VYGESPSSSTRSFPFRLKRRARPSDKATALSVATFPGGEWEHGVVEGPTLRRPWRGWISTVSSGSALAVALTLMSMADVGRPSARPERVVTSLGPGPTVNHQGSGNAILPTPGPPGKPFPKAFAASPVELQPAPPGTAPPARAQLAASVTPDSGLTVRGKGVLPTMSPTPAVPTPPTTRPADRAGGSRNVDGGGTPRTRRDAQLVSESRSRHTGDEFSGCPSAHDGHSRAARHDGSGDGRRDPSHGGERGERW
jgi:hypothetical protein